MQKFTHMFKKAMKNTKNMLTMEHIMEESKERARTVLFDFSDARSIDHFHLMTDEGIGGGSKASFYFDGEKAVFEGNLDLTVPERQEGMMQVDHSGYAAIVSKSFHWDLEEYDALMMEAKTDGRIYVSNIKASGVVPDELYQSHAVGKEGEWSKIILPFQDYTLTNRGFVGKSSGLDTRDVETLGILMAQRKDGPFRMEIKNICAVNMDFFEPEKRRWTGISEDHRDF